MLDDGWRVLGNGVLGLVFEDKRFGDERLEMVVGDKRFGDERFGDERLEMMVVVKKSLCPK